METHLSDIVRELLDFIEENNISDIHNISWISDEDCYVESERSTEWKDIIQKVEEAIKE